MSECTSHVTISTACLSVDVAHTGQPPVHVAVYDTVFISCAFILSRSSLKWFLNDKASSCDEGLVHQLLSTAATVEEVLRRYQPEEICLAFNGGKDCTVLLDFFAAMWSRYGGPV